MRAHCPGFSKPGQAHVVAAATEKMVVTFIFQRPLVCLPTTHATGSLKFAPPSIVLILFARMRFPKALSHMSKKRRAREQAVDTARNRLFTRAALCQSGMNAAFEVLDDVFAGAQRERHD